MKVWRRLGLVFTLAAFPAQGAAVMEGTQPWPEATVAYHFEPALLKAAGAKGRDCAGWRTWRETPAKKACRAMDAWTVAAGVHFQHDELRLDGLYIHGGEGTSATVGHLWALNRMSIETGASYGAVLHEFGHVLGLMHEHQRPDRDRYLTLAPFLRDDLKTCGFGTDPVCNDVRMAFPVVKVAMSTPYDPCSLMHYLSDQTPRHREDQRWSRIYTLTTDGEAALKGCVGQFASLPKRCHRPGQKCAISIDDAALVRRFNKAL